MALFDLKGGLELAYFSYLPHAILPVAGTPMSAVKTLERVCRELDRRLQEARGSVRSPDWVRSVGIRLVCRTQRRDAEAVPGQLRAGLDGAYDMVASPPLLAELERALAYPKIRRRIPVSDAAAAVGLIERQARVGDDPDEPPLVRSPDPGADYLIALAAAARAVLVSGDRHVLGLDPSLPIHSPAPFLARLGEGAGAGSRC